MNPVTLLQPQRIVFGCGCAANCVETLAGRKARRLLLVTSASVLAQIGPLLDSLTAAGCEVIRAPFVKPEPTRAMFEEVLRVARDGKVDGVLGVGGGSVLDVAKLAAALARSSQNVQDVFGINLLQSRELFLVCLPTTSGTGSEVSPNAVLLDETAELKKAVVSPHLVPDAAFIDPLLTLSAPPSLTAATGVDALTHCIEAYANLFSHPIVDAYALLGMRLISGSLLRAVQDGSDREARERMALGSLYGGLCLGPVNTAAVHALAYPLGGRFHVAHGVSNAVLLPHVLRFNLQAAPQLYASVAQAMIAGMEDGTHMPTSIAKYADSTTARASAERGIERIAELSRACGVPQRMADLGIPHDAIPAMAKQAMQVTRLLKNNPRPVTEKDAIEIYEAAF